MLKPRVVENIWLLRASRDSWSLANSNHRRDFNKMILDRHTTSAHSKCTGQDHRRVIGSIREVDADFANYLTIRKSPMAMASIPAQ